MPASQAESLLNAPAFVQNAVNPTARLAEGSIYGFRNPLIINGFLSLSGSVACFVQKADATHRFLGNPGAGQPMINPEVMNYPFKNMRRLLARPVARFTALAVIFLSPGGLVMITSSRAQESDQGAEVLTRGPVHEGFAGTIAFKATPGLLVPKAPPSAIEEIPPDQRPDGDNVTWIPGYWAWNDEDSGFLWVSGIWRNLPPGRQWMPGYWWQTGQDYQWISGYWADAAVEEVEYLDEPPASIEAGPNIGAPSRNHTWIPGTWRWRESRYLWQPGYWFLAQPDWVWTPSYYTSSPRGFIYVDGYYDYDVARRGMLFAPVRFSGDYYSRPDYYYRPTTVISITGLLDHLFLRPRNRHYYFGDYYAPEYRRSGYYASYSYYSGGHGYDPIYAHQRWTHRDDDRWERRYEDNFNYYRDHSDERPPHTLSAYNSFMARPDANRRVEAGFATRLDQLASSKETKFRFKAVNEAEQKNFAQRGREIREFGEQRKKSGDRKAGDPGSDKSGKGGQGRGEPTRVKTPKSPIMAKTTGGRGREDTPPERPKESSTDDKSGGKRDSDQRGGKPKDQPGGKPDRGTPRQPTAEPKGDPKDPARRNPRQDPKADPNKGPSKEQPKADPQNPRQREPKGEPKPRTNPEPKGEPQQPRNQEPKKESKAEPKREPRAEPKREASKPQPKAEPRREPKPEQRKAEPKREPSPQPKQQPKAEPRREPKPEQRKAEPKREAPPQPKQQPKAEPRQQPKAPPAEPSAPKKSKDNPDGKEDKDKRR